MATTSPPPTRSTSRRGPGDPQVLNSSQFVLHTFSVAFGPTEIVFGLMQIIVTILAIQILVTFVSVIVSSVEFGLVLFGLIVTSPFNLPSDCPGSQFCLLRRLLMICCVLSI